VTVLQIDLPPRAVAVADGAEAEKPLLFLPGLVTDGIEPSNDPLIAVRDGAYAESYARRNP
jgi:catalase